MIPLIGALLASTNESNEAMSAKGMRQCLSVNDKMEVLKFIDENSEESLSCVACKFSLFRLIASVNQSWPFPESGNDRLGMSC